VNPRAREHRFRRLKEMGCVACWLMNEVPQHPEIHHLNEGGHAGQKRRGDEFTIPLCVWHHQGRTDQFTLRYGPSLAKQSREFRRVYGTDDELLSITNHRVRVFDALSEAERSQS
jgi:hypothetical protein